MPPNWRCSTTGNGRTCVATEQSSPPAAAAWWRKGVAYEQLGQPKQALTCHQQALELDPAFSLARQALDRLQAKGK